MVNEQVCLFRTLEKALVVCQGFLNYGLRAFLMYLGFLKLDSGNLYIDISANFPGNFQKIRHIIIFLDSGLLK